MPNKLFIMNVKKIISVISLVLIFFGGYGFIRNAFIGMGIIDYPEELPLGGEGSLLVDKDDNIYLLLDFYNKIQVYNNKGEFLRNFRIPHHRYHVNFYGEDQIRVVFDANNTDYGTISLSYFDLMGNFIKSEDTKSKPPQNFSNEKKYVLEGWFFPKIIKKDSIDRVIISQNRWTQFFFGPNLSWYIFALGGLLFFISNKEKIINKMNRFSEHTPR